MYLFALALLVALVVQGPDVVEAAGVNVTVYYESLCPDSIRFYVNQLYPTMEVASLSTNVDLELVPYGKSKYTRSEDGSLKFECHHGERECYGNKVHSCALEQLTSKNERLGYLNCLLKSMLEDRKIVFPAEKCADQLSIAAVDKEKIINCANTTRGDELLAKMGDKTQMLQPKLSSVPTVVFNNKYDQNDFTNAQTNFKGVLCKYMPSPKPAECAGTSGSASLSASFILAATVALLLSRN